MLLAFSLYQEVSRRHSLPKNAMLSHQTVKPLALRTMDRLRLSMNTPQQRHKHNKGHARQQTVPLTLRTIERLRLSMNTTAPASSLPPSLVPVRMSCREKEKQMDWRLKWQVGKECESALEL